MSEFPRDAIYRAAGEPMVLRAADAGMCQGEDCPGCPMCDPESADMPDRMLVGHFAVFNSWTEINSAWEGNFLERVAPGAFRKTFRENLAGMRCLFQHGRDPQVGDKPIGSIDSLREDQTGASYEVSLFHDATYVRDLVPGLAAGVYGASFRFQVMREDIVQTPEASTYNPRGLPERTIREARVSEFGPVTFPAYADATAGLRSITDDMAFRTLATRTPERFAELAGRYTPQIAPEAATAPAEDAGPSTTPTSDARRDAEPQSRPLHVIRNPNRARRVSA